MTNLNDETMGPYIETVPNSTEFHAEHNETMCRVANSLRSDEQFNSHNEIPIGNTTITQVDIAKQIDPLHSGLTRILSDSRHESDSTNTNQAVPQNIERNPNKEMQQDIEGNGTTNIDIKLVMTNHVNLLHLVPIHTMTRKTKIMKSVKLAHIGMTTHSLSVCSTLIKLRTH